MVLPLTVKGKNEKQGAILRVVGLARRIPDLQQRMQVLAGILTFTDKIIEEGCRRSVKEELEMTQVGKMIFDDGVKRGLEQGVEQGQKQGGNIKLVGQTCRKLRKGKTQEAIAGELEEALEIIQEICKAAIPFAPDYDCDKVYNAWAGQ